MYMYVLHSSLVAAAKDRKARLEDARNLYQFLEDHEEEEGEMSHQEYIQNNDFHIADIT